MIFWFFLIQLISVPHFNSVVTDNKFTNSCSPINSTAEPNIKTINNKNCFFPFNYKNKTYNDCITYGTTASKFCPTSCNLEVDNELSLCRWERKNLLEPTCANITKAQASKEPSTVSDGMCVFPFVYKGKCYDDCITLDSYQLWCGATESCDLNPSKFHVCYYNRSINEQKDCENLRKAKPSLHPETIKNGKCIFPFVYKNKCYDDCVEDQGYWCSYTKGHTQSDNWSYCKYSGNFKKYETFLTYGIYRITSNCLRGDFCGGTVVASNKTIDTPVQITQKSKEYLINSWEILPQPNSSIIIRTPKSCQQSNQPFWKYSNNHQIVLQELSTYEKNTRFILNPHPNTTGIYFLTSISEKAADSNLIIGYQITSSNTESIPLESYPLPMYWQFELIRKLDMDVSEDPCGVSTTPSSLTTQNANQFIIQSNNKLESDLTSVKITVYVTIAICLVMLITIFAIIIIMCRNH